MVARRSGERGGPSSAPSSRGSGSGAARGRSSRWPAVQRGRSGLSRRGSAGSRPVAERSPGGNGQQPLGSRLRVSSGAGDRRGWLALEMAAWPAGEGARPAAGVRARSPPPSRTAGRPAGRAEPGPPSGFSSIPAGRKRAGQLGQVEGRRRAD